MDASYFLDAPRRVLILDDATRVGAALVSMFTGLLPREFGPASFVITRTPAAPSAGRAA